MALVKDSLKMQVLCSWISAQHVDSALFQGVKSDELKPRTQTSLPSASGSILLAGIAALVAEEEEGGAATPQACSNFPALLASYLCLDMGYPVLSSAQWASDSLKSES